MSKVVCKPLGPYQHFRSDADSIQCALRTARMTILRASDDINCVCMHSANTGQKKVQQYGTGTRRRSQYFIDIIIIIYIALSNIHMYVCTARRTPLRQLISSMKSQLNSEERLHNAGLHPLQPTTHEPATPTPL